MYMAKKFLDKILDGLIVKRGKDLPFIVFVAALVSFVAIRAINYFLTKHNIKASLVIGDVHIHHFLYGIIIVCAVGFYAVINFEDLVESRRLRYVLAALYGFGLALIFDEFRMWLELDKNLYWSYDGIVIFILVFLNIVYFRGFWQKTGRFFYFKLLKRIFSRRAR